ncbi:MAG: hypothetical protein K2N20_00700 [Helicobacter sp.]|nr:hypothetical protein [Helicobacter sp.]
MNFSKEKAFFRVLINKIKKEPNRDTLDYIQRAMCKVILPRWDDFEREYKNHSGFKDCNDIESFLASLFDIDLEIIQIISKTLEDFKNQNDKEALEECLCVHIKLPSSS